MLPIPEAAPPAPYLGPDTIVFTPGGSRLHTNLPHSDLGVSSSSFKLRVRFSPHDIVRSRLSARGVRWPPVQNLFIDRARLMPGREDEATGGSSTPREAP